MKRFHAAFVVAAAMLAGCRDAQTPSGPGYTVAPSTSARQTLVGTVVANSEQRIFPALLLRLDDGTFVGLDGSEARPLRSVLGAVVQIDGTMDGDSAFEVERFVVLAVGGSPVLDGVLEPTGDGAYELRLTTGGNLGITDPPEELAAHIGERVWLMPADPGSPIEFGVIRA